MDLILWMTEWIELREIEYFHPGELSRREQFDSYRVVLC